MEKRKKVARPLSSGGTLSLELLVAVLLTLAVWIVLLSKFLQDAHAQ